MNIQQNYVITISRDIASGGSAVAEELARQLGVKVVNKSKLASLTEKFGMNATEILERKRNNSASFGDSYYELVLNTSSDMMEDTSSVNTKSILEAECALLKEYARQESFVTIGRAGYWAFKNAPNCLHIFLYCNKQKRVANLMQKEGLDETAAKIKIANADQKRDDFMKENMGVSRYDLRNYDLVLDISDGNVEKVVKTILSYLY